MKILYIDYNMFGKDDIIDAFNRLGHKVDITDCPVRFGEDASETKKIINELLAELQYDAVFTSNYYPMVSNICNEYHITYISWTYDSPRIALYDNSINNVCNYAFVFDSAEYQKLRSKGVTRVFYMPLGVNADRVNSIKINDTDHRNYDSDVSIVASLYNEEHNLYDRMYSKLEDYYKGVFDAVIQAQRNLFGGYILEEVLSDDMIDVMYEAMPYPVSVGSYADLKYVYANYFLARKTATYQRLDFIKAISEKYIMKVYSPGNLDNISKAIHMGTVDYNTDMNKVFKLSKINLNITLPSIQRGIPLRALDIMGVGGFLLTDYRADFEGLFEAGEDYIYYTSLEDAMNKIQYYLEHDEERMQIAKNGRRKVELGLTYEKRVMDMLEIVNS